jgi:glutathionylspermidine synthase
MHRLLSRPRPNWERTVEGQGLIYHHTQGGLYWNEGAYYQFSSHEVDELEAATNELQRIALQAGQLIVDERRFQAFGIPDAAVDAIVWAWDAEPPAIYGRFDLAYDGIQPPKLLEYNADTPTALLEASIVQWYWLQDLHPKDDQFNSIHEHLVAKWKELKQYCASPLYFAAAEDVQAEDLMTATYLRDTATEAGHETAALLMKDIGWDAEAHAFVDLDGKPIKSIFKLYPWEWLVHEAFGPHLLDTCRDVQWIEPIWKMMWANKALLAVLWEMFPDHPNLLPAYLDGPRDLQRYVKKPKMAREGANLTYVSGANARLETGGDYGDEGFVYQALAPVPVMDGNYVVIGSWVVDGVSCGMGVRESDGPITDNLSRFVPHLFRS